MAQHNYMVEQKLKLKVKLDDESKILGYYVKDQFWGGGGGGGGAINLILTVRREYIFQCSKNNQKLNIYYLQTRIKEIFLEQQNLCSMRSSKNIFSKRWCGWEQLDILGINEVHWTGQGKTQIEDKTIIYSSRDDQIHREGIAFMLSKNTVRSLID